MSDSASTILLTGSTGLLGRYLLRELLLADLPVAVLVRGSVARTAKQRIQAILQECNAILGTRLPEPTVLVGDLASPDLGMNKDDLRWASTHCTRILHAAASLEFRKTESNEPFRTNVDGTRQLVNWSANAGISEFHYVSTAFVCGSTASNPVMENDVSPERVFNNPYEQSKWEAETVVRQNPNLLATIYRPTIIVGDSKTGYTSTYHGIYRFAEMADRLASPRQRQKKSIEIRLPMTGEEPRNLVPVDWVASAISRIVLQPTLHGKTYHLATRKPLPVRIVKEAGDEVFGWVGMGWGGSEVMDDPTFLERHFLIQLYQYTPYLSGDPVFDTTNLCGALPNLPPPAIDREVLLRLFRFAKDHHWGNPSRIDDDPKPQIDAKTREFMEDIFPRLARKSSLGRTVKLEIVVGIDITGRNGGQWTMRWEAGELVAVERGFDANAVVRYRMDLETFKAIVNGKQSPAQAFFEQRLQLEGDLEKGFKLAVWFEQLLQEDDSVRDPLDRRGMGIRHA